MTMNGRGPRRKAWEGRSVAEGFLRRYPTFSAASGGAKKDISKKEGDR